MKKYVKNATEARELTRYLNGTQTNLEEFLEIALKQITEAAWRGNLYTNLYYYDCPIAYMNEDETGFIHRIDEGMKELQALGFKLLIVANEYLEISW